MEQERAAEGETGLAEVMDLAAESAETGPEQG